jgi:hypothetical protein
VREEE